MTFGELVRMMDRLNRLKELREHLLNSKEKKTWVNAIYGPQLREVEECIALLESAELTDEI